MNIAFVGLGSMGAPLARLIARSGATISVYDEIPQAREKFDGIAVLTSSPAQAASGADVACVCVRDDQQVRNVILGENGLVEGLPKGALILIHSTIHIQTLHELKEALEPLEIGLLDAPISRTRMTEDAPFVFTMFGGEVVEVERAKAVVSAFSTNVEHMGPLGAGMAVKIANNLVTWVQLVIGAQAVSLTSYNGVDFDKLLEVMTANGNLTPIMRAMLANKRIASTENDAFLLSQAGIGEKDLALAIESGRAAGIEMGLAEAARLVLLPVMTAPLQSILA